MTASIQSRRMGAIVVSAALVAALAASAFAVPVSAAKPKCMGKTATIVGTRKADVIRGTAKRDVIVAKAGNDVILGRGGNDIVCGGPGNDRIVGQGGADRLVGQTGNDRIFGGPGVDRLFGGGHHDLLAGGPGPDVLGGGGGNDRLDGGIGVDTCVQGPGTGPRIRCERPQVLLPTDGILAVAYGDIDGLDGYSTGDVLISKYVDSDGNGEPSVGDTIHMGKYPTTLGASSAAHYVSWGVSQHTVTGVGPSAAQAGGGFFVYTADGRHAWSKFPGVSEEYAESTGADHSQFADADSLVKPDWLETTPTTPSKPQSSLQMTADHPGDDAYIDVDVYFHS